MEEEEEKTNETKKKKEKAEKDEDSVEDEEDGLEVKRKKGVDIELMLVALFSITLSLECTNCCPVLTPSFVCVTHFNSLGQLRSIQGLRFRRDCAPF